MELKEALESVVNECSDQYAKEYARAALELGEANHHFITEHGGVVAIQHVATGKMMVGEEMRVQLLYVLSNTQYWRGDKAKEVKKVLKEYSK